MAVTGGQLTVGSGFSRTKSIDLGMLMIITRGSIAISFELETGARRHLASGTSCAAASACTPSRK
jgi:hypothetical protein